jgi:hypothetical protein
VQTEWHFHEGICGAPGVFVDTWCHHPPHTAHVPHDFTPCKTVHAEDIQLTARLREDIRRNWIPYFCYGIGVWSGLQMGYVAWKRCRHGVR